MPERARLRVGVLASGRGSNFQALVGAAKAGRMPADVVVLIDGYPQPAGPATDATERIVRGVAQVVQTALRKGDRAGIVALGGRRPRWLGADIGQRQFYRVLDAVLDTGGEFETTTGTLAPRAAMPPGARLARARNQVARVRERTGAEAPGRRVAESPADS